MAYTLDATFTVDSNPVTGVCSTSYATVVNLELQSTNGVNTIAWAFIGQSNSNYTAPAITPAGSPTGKTASFTMIADPGNTLGATFLLQCTVTDSNGATDSKRALISVANDLGEYPLASDETLERDSSYGYIDILNYLLGLAASFPSPGTDTTNDKSLTALATASDGDAALASGISNTPVWDCYVGVRVNGHHVSVGDGVKTDACYFSNDGGTTARAMADIASGDILYWNGTVAGYELEVTDLIDLCYEVVVSP